MCGIFAMMGSNVVDRVYKGLQKLEYRGYDSCGMGIFSGDDIKVFRALGYVEKLSETGVLKEESNVAIAHTRWATNGGVTVENSHPHKSCTGRFAVVHNGIIENDIELKNTYLQNVHFNSETDTEVIVQLMDKFASNQTTFDAFKQVVKLLEGSYAIVLVERNANIIYFARKSSPLVISKTEDGFALSSDINGFEDKSNIYYVLDNSIGYIDNNLCVFDNNNTEVHYEWSNYTNDLYTIDKAGYKHYMLKEIMEIPMALRSTYQAYKNAIFNLPRLIDRLLIIGCGTSFHSGLMGAKYIEKFAGVKTECLIASEFIYNDYLVEPNTLAIFISQSGETADILKAIEKAKNLNLFTFAITNVEGSSITRMVDSYVCESVGVEVCVASTKAYCGQVFMLLLLSGVIANVIDENYPILTNDSDFVRVSFGCTVNVLDYSAQDLEKLFKLDIQAILNSVDQVITEFYDTEQVFIIGKDYDYITAREGALKIKEVSYIFTDCYPCGELKHGTLALIDNNGVIVSIMTREDIKDKCLNSMREIVARGGNCIVVTNIDNDDNVLKYKNIIIPNLNEMFVPIISVIPLDLIAYRLSTYKGYNPDKPRNLAKSVTVE